MINQLRTSTMFLLIRGVSFPHHQPNIHLLIIYAYKRHLRSKKSWVSFPFQNVTRWCMRGIRRASPSGFFLNFWLSFFSCGGQMREAREENEKPGSFCVRTGCLRGEATKLVCVSHTSSAEWAVAATLTYFIVLFPIFSSFFFPSLLLGI